MSNTPTAPDDESIAKNLENTKLAMPSAARKRRARTPPPEPGEVGRLEAAVQASLENYDRVAAVTKDLDFPEDVV